MGTAEFFRKRWPWVVSTVVLGGGSATGYVTRAQWLPYVTGRDVLTGDKSSKSTTSKSDSGREHDDGHGHGPDEKGHEGHDHAGHDHAAESHTEPDNGRGDAPLGNVFLSDQAKENLGLEIGPVVVTDYWKKIAIPGSVAEEPGHCERRISTTVNGIILKVHALQGQTVKPGDPLFDIQPTSELLTTTQSGLLKTLKEIEIVGAEVNRLKDQVEQAGLARNQFVAKEGELKRLESQRLVQMQELLVRGLSPQQIKTIVDTKTLIRQFTVRVPKPVSDETDQENGTSAARDRVPVLTVPVIDSEKLITVANPGRRQSRTADAVDHTRLLPISHAVDQGEKSTATTSEHAHTDDHRDSTSAPVKSGSAPHLKDHQHAHDSVYTLEQLNVSLGKLVQPGEELCQLASHTVLLIEGHAFERENAMLTKAVEEQWPISALFETGEKDALQRDGLKILYIDNAIDETHRTLNFHVPLKNEVVRDGLGANGLMYRTWRFKPGQKARLMVPVKYLDKCIVLPADAVVKEGPDAFVFRQNGKLMEQVAVTIEHLDPRQAVIKDDGNLFEGDEVALNQAYQLHLALKKAQSGGDGGAHQGHDHDH